MANDYVGWGLILGIEDGLDGFIDDATEVVNSLGTGIPPRDLATFSSESTEDGIKLTFTPPGATYLPEHTASDGKQFACMPAGVLIRYSDTGYPRTPDEGKFGYDYKPTGDWVTTSQECTIVGLTKDTKYYFTAFPYSTEHVYNKNQVTANRTEMTWVGNKGTISVTVQTPEGYEGTLGEYTITLVDQAESGGQNETKTATGAGLTQFGGLTAGKSYKVRLSNTDDLQAPPDSEAITIVGGVNYDVTMTYALMYGTITVNVSTQPAGMPIGAYTVTLTPQGGGDAMQQSGSNSQAVVFSNVKNGVVYTVGLSAINHYTANAGGAVTAVGGQNTQHNAQYVFSATFSESSWAEVQAVARSGQASSFYSVGEYKTTRIQTASGQITADNVSLSNKQTKNMQVTIVGINVHANAVELMTTEDFPMYIMSLTGGERNQGELWSESGLRSYLNDNVSEILPDAHSYIKKVNIKTREIGVYKNGANYSQENNLVAVSDYVFLPSVSSLGFNSNAGEGDVYPYFKSNSDRVIKSSKYRTRSSLVYNPTWPSSSGMLQSYWYIMEDGSLCGSGNNNIEAAPNINCYVPICFCIG